MHPMVINVTVTIVCYLYYLLGVYDYKENYDAENYDLVNSLYVNEAEHQSLVCRKKPH